jgi:hypothetical protein
MATKQRFVRISDDTWELAMARADKEKTNISELIRTWVELYAAGDESLTALAGIIAKLNE